MSRVPIRRRVTLAFALVMAVVLGAVGLFLYLELRASLDETIDDNLETRSAELTNSVQDRPVLGRPGRYALLFSSEDSFSELLTADGRLIASSRPDGKSTALTGEEIAAAASSPVTVERRELAGVDGSARILAFGLPTARRELVGVVGLSLSDRDETLTRLLTLLAIGLPLALALASLTGYLALSAALRPVDSMRRRAAEISAGEPGERLPVPPADDELRRLGETLNEMLGRLEAAFERERRFVDDASHELRTPLTLHKTELELALRHAGDERELRGAIASALEEVDRLVQLAEDLLVVARSEEGELALKRAPIPVAELFAGVAERFRARAAQAGRALVLEDPGAAVVDGDRIRLEQALTSLVDNSLRYGEGEVRLAARSGRSGVELHVIDEGAGFPEEFLDRAFERFSRADSARARGGTGLGLSIVETIARAHGGVARAANLSGGGADVWVEIPAERSA